MRQGIEGVMLVPADIVQRGCEPRHVMLRLPYVAIS